MDEELRNKLEKVIYWNKVYRNARREENAGNISQVLGLSSETETSRIHLLTSIRLLGEYYELTERGVIGRGNLRKVGNEYFRKQQS